MFQFRFLYMYLILRTFQDLKKKMFIANFIKIWNHYLQKCLMLDIFNRYAMP